MFWKGLMAPMVLERVAPPHPKIDLRPNSVLEVSWWLVHWFMTNHVVCLTILAHDDAFLSCFCVMGSNEASRVESDGIWKWWDGLTFWEGDYLCDLIIDNFLSLDWILRLWLASPGSSEERLRRLPHMEDLWLMVCDPSLGFSRLH